MRSFRVLLLVGLVLACAISIPSYARDAAADATEAAESWLGLVDTGEYSKSWLESSELFRNAVTQEQWTRSMTAVRGPLGELVSRKVKSAEYATELPGAPDGEYVVIRFETVFANKKAAIETVTPMKDPDGVWRVSGYFVK